MSTIEDMQWLKETVDSIHNGFTMCTGSYGVRADNDLVRMIETFGDRIHFTHLRATCREENPKTFHEAAHGRRCEYGRGGRRHSGGRGAS